jgi:hypothetical protein
MKHLSEEERLAFLEGRAAKETSDHINQCASCAAQIEAWRRSVQRLKQFQWPARMERPAISHSPVIKWALAASVVLCVGFGLGRFTGPNAAQIQAAIKADVTRDFQRQLAATLREQRKAELDPKTVLALLNDLREQQNANYISLRKDLETLASTADARLQSNTRQIRELAASTQAFSDPTH